MALMVLCLFTALPVTAQQRLDLSKATPVQKMQKRAEVMKQYPLLSRIIQPGTHALPVYNNEELKASRPSRPIATPTEVMRRVAAPTVIWGNVVSQNTWKRYWKPYGMYRFNVADPIVVDSVGTNKKMNINGGGMIIGDKYYAIYYEASLFGVLVYYRVFDTTTWQLVNEVEIDDIAYIGSDLTYDRVNNKAYGCFYNDDATAYELAEIACTDDDITRTTIGSLNLKVVALGVDSKGDLYGVCEDGVLYKFDKQTGAATAIGDTGVKVASSRGIQPQSGDIDQHTDVFYWAAVDVYGNHDLYTVDLHDGHATKYASFPNNENIVSLTVQVPSADDKAPNFLQNFEASYPDGILDGTISFDAPEDTYDGTTLEGDLTYHILVNGTEVKTGTVKPGGHVAEQVTVEQGTTNFQAYVENAVGPSPRSEKQFWVGQDTPRLTNVTLDVDDENVATVNWTRDEMGVNGGYPGHVTYKVERHPDNVVVADSTAATTITDTLDGNRVMTKYSYTVTPRNGNLVGEPMESNPKQVGAPLEPPYYQPFDDESSFDILSTTDYDRDGTTWQYYNGDDFWGNLTFTSAVDPEGSEERVFGNDWLLTPPIHLSAGKMYEFSVDARSQNGNYKDEFKVCYGTGDDPNNYATLIPPTEVTAKYGASSDMTTFSKTFTNYEDMVVRFGIVRTKALGEYVGNFYVDNITLTAGFSAEAPDSVTSLMVIPDETGDLKATVVFNAPAYSIDGSDLESIDSVVVTRGDLTNVRKVFTNVTPGDELSFDDTVEEDKDYTWTAIAYNYAGQGIKNSITAFVGQDAPGNVDWLKISDNETTIGAQWPRVGSKGANGRYVNADQVTYNIYQYNNGYQKLVGDLTDTTTVYSYNTDEGEQGMLQLYVAAKNRVGISAATPSNYLLVGKPYTLPIHESLENGEVSHLLWLSSTDTSMDINEGNGSSDGDGWSFVWDASVSEQDSLSMNSGKISLAGTTNPRLAFSYKIFGGDGDRIEVIATTPDGVEHNLATFDYQEEDKWNTSNISLADYIGERYIMLTLRMFKNMDNVDLYYIDNINVLDALDHDLAATVKVPGQKTKAGHEAEVTVTVTNYGEQDAADYTVNLYADGNLFGTKTGSGLAFMKSADFKFFYPVPNSQKAPVQVRAEVVLDGDQNADNDVDSAAIDVQQTKLSAPEALTAEIAGSDVNLQWQAPTSWYEEDVTEDWESYTPWSITDFGDWTVFDGDGNSTIGLEEADFPHNTDPMAFIVFNPSSIGVPDANTEAVPFSGKQYLVCFAAKQTIEHPHNDDWLISPVLPGKAQTITFQAKEMVERYGPEQIEVLYSTTTKDTASFVKVASFDIENADDWQEYSVDLPDSSRYFAIRVITEGGHMFMLDDVNYRAGSSRNITAYNIYRNGKRIATVKGDVLTYADKDAPVDDLTYNVTAVYDGSEESGFSNDATVSTGISLINGDADRLYNVYTLDGKAMRLNARELSGLQKGVYVVNGTKMVVK